MLRDQRAHRRGLFLRRQIADRAVDDLSPRRAPRRRRAAVVDADDDVAGFGQRAMEQQLRAAPRIVDRLPRRLAVDVRDERIFLRRVEGRRLQHVAIELNAFADVDAEELRRRIEQRLHLRDHRGRIGQRAHRLVARQLDHLRQRRLLELRVGVERQLAVRRHVVAMRARLIGRRHALGRAAAVELRSIQVALAGVVRRGAEVHVAGLLVEAGDVGHVGVELRDQLTRAAFTRHAIDVLEAVPSRSATGRCGRHRPTAPPRRLRPTDGDSSRNTRFTAPLLMSAVRKSLRFCWRLSCWIDTVFESIQPMRAR